MLGEQDEEVECHDDSDGQHRQRPSLSDLFKHTAYRIKSAVTMSAREKVCEG